MDTSSTHGELHFSRLAKRLLAGDADAETLVVRRFTIQLVALARRQLAQRIRQKAAPEDVVQSVFRSFFTRLRGGQLDLQSWDSLWSLLILMTVRKCAGRRAHFLAARRDVRRELALPSEICDADMQSIPVSREPRPDEAEALAELVQQLLSGLSDGEQQIVQWRLQGYQIAEIAAMSARAERTVRRVLTRARSRALRFARIDVDSPAPPPRRAEP